MPSGAGEPCTVSQVPGAIWSVSAEHSQAPAGCRTLSGRGLGSKEALFVYRSHFGTHKGDC